MTETDNEIFVAKLKNIFGNKYDYSKIKYVDEHIKVKLICSVHGEFEKNPFKLLRGEGCPKCAIKGINAGPHEKAEYSKEKTNEFIRKAKEIHGNEYDYSKVKYTNATTKVEIICPTHGSFLMTPNSHLAGHGCPKCGKKIISTKKLTNEEFIRRAKEIHGDKYDYSKVKYENNKTPVEIICPIHGSFFQAPSRHLNFKCGCPKCGHKTVSKEEFIKRAKEIHGDIYDYSKAVYEDFRSTKVEIICKEHGSFWQTPCEHLRHECPICSRTNKSHAPKSKEQFIKEAKEKFPEYDYSLADYKNNYTKIKIICPKHGEFIKYPYEILNGGGCPRCSESKGERAVRTILEERKIKFQQEYSFDGCRNKGNLRFDFWLPDYNTVIEYQGIQHYEPVDIFGGEEKLKIQIDNDSLKREFCSRNGIRELEIKYTDSVEEKLKSL